MFLFFLRNFLKDSRGAVLPLFGLMVVVMVVIGGVAIDISRAVNAREKLSYAIDAAALSVATSLSTSVMTDDEITQAIEDSFRGNLSNEEFLEKAITNLDFDVNSDEGTITISSSASLSTYFLDIGGYGIDAFGPDAFNFGTSAQVAYSTFDVELALVIDVTGSMSSDMSALRTAAESVVNILIPADSDPSTSKVRISLIPYSQGVNLGSYANTVTNGDSTSNNCVNEREGAEKYTDAAYNSGGRSDYFHGRPDYFVDDRGRREYWYSGDDDCPSTAVYPLTSNRSTLVDEIRDLRANNGTGGQVGIAWGWYTISPNWTNLWPTESDPAAYGSGSADDDTKKFALIMTDGDFNAEYSREERTTCSRRRCTTNEYWVERYHRYSDYSDPPAVRARTLCDAMKDDNIEIYTIFFDTGGSDFGDDLMSYCATDADYYYEAGNSAQLIQAFSNIAKKIQQIYLSR